MRSPEVTIIIPIYNEETLLESAIEDLREQLAAAKIDYALCLAENGSSDRTALVAASLAERYPELSTFSVGEPNYGRALRLGIERARTRFVICEEIDLCDASFHVQALAILRSEPVDMVVGSKLLATSQDDRPRFRHFASHAYNGLLRLAFGFRGTDTHGLKAFRRTTVAPVATTCVVDRDVFASELVIRAYATGLRVREIPVHLVEKRPPSVHLWRRVPNVLKNLARLAIAIRAGR